jgi:molybdopterin-guanine dinucleotide biosynthesis protein A
MTTAAIVLAGGKSTRLGRDKATAPLLGVPLLQHVLNRLSGLTDEYMIVTRPDQKLDGIATGASRVVEDLFPDSGPLGGLYTGLSSIESPIAIAIACDMPLLHPPLLCELLHLLPEHDAVVPLSEGQPQPLCAAYAKSCLAPILRQLETGNLKLTDVLARLDIRYVDPDEWRLLDPDGLSFQNVNRDEDLRRVAKLLESQASNPAQTGWRL